MSQRAVFLNNLVGGGPGVTRMSNRYSRMKLVPDPALCKMQEKRARGKKRREKGSRNAGKRRAAGERKQECRRKESCGRKEVEMREEGTVQGEREMREKGKMQRIMKEKCEMQKCRTPHGRKYCFGCTRI